MGQLVPEPVVAAGKGRRKFNEILFGRYSRRVRIMAKKRNRDFVALAVASEERIITDAQVTGMGGDREKNMVEFARLGLELLKNTILQNRKGPTEETI